MEENCHGGHRDRIKKKFLKNGMRVMEKHEILELMLFYSIPRHDTNPIAHELLRKFGSISALIDAPVEVLKKERVSENTIVYLKMIPEICRLYMEEKAERIDTLDMHSAIQIMSAKLVGRTEEAVVLMLFNSARARVFCDIVSYGTVEACEMYSRKMMEIAVSNKATYALIAHNHPSGLLMPSKADIDTTNKLIRNFAMVGVTLEDHLIISDKGYFSFRETGFMEM